MVDICRGALSRVPRAPSINVTTVGQLAASVADPAAVGLDSSRLVLLGGLNGEDTSTASITVWEGGAGARRGALPVPQHDAQAAQVGHYERWSGFGVSHPSALIRLGSEGGEVGGAAAED